MPGAAPGLERYRPNSLPFAPKRGAQANAGLALSLEQEGAQADFAKNPSRPGLSRVAIYQVFCTSAPHPSAPRPQTS